MPGAKPITYDKGAMSWAIFRQVVVADGPEWDYFRIADDTPGTGFVRCGCGCWKDT